MYDYREAVKDDIIEYIKFEGLEITEDNKDEMYDKLNEELWDTDSVTGNASGSYTFNRWKAREYVLENLPLLETAAASFGCDAREVAGHFLNNDWEWFDVTIRCYLLGECLNEVLDELEHDTGEGC